MANATDIKFLRMTLAVADIFSKDPSSKVGAVTVGSSGNQVAFGYNGFPPGVRDTPARLADRETKYELTIHAEENALINSPFNVKTLYVTHHICGHCALRVLAQRTVTRVVYLHQPEFEERWSDSIKAATLLLKEGRVQIEGVTL